MKCLECGAVLNDSAKFCMKCGAKVSDRDTILRRFCNNCGAEVNEEDAFCEECGYRLVKQENEHTEDNTESKRDISFSGQSNVSLINQIFSKRYFVLGIIVICIFSVVFLAIYSINNSNSSINNKRVDEKDSMGESYDFNDNSTFIDTQSDELSAQSEIIYHNEKRDILLEVSVEKKNESYVKKC